MKVAIFGNDHQSDKLPQIRRLFDSLKRLDIEICVKRQFHTFLSAASNEAFQPDCIFDRLPPGLDMALSVGGDGTFLRTAEQIGNSRVPILGINTGRLGFLADVSCQQIEETLDELANHQYMVEERMRLALQSDNNLFSNSNTALNEVAILKRDTSSMITIHTYLNGEFLTSYRADGLIIATPTGSTAYSMSVNGPILLPQSDNIILTPVAPHSLNVRPLVIPGNSNLSLTAECRSQSLLVALDGRSEVVSSGACVSVQKSDSPLLVVKRIQQTFYRTLREKLMWGIDERFK